MLLQLACRSAKKSALVTMEGEGNEIYHTTTKRGKPKLVRAGYAYVQDKRGGNCIYWRCEKRDQLQPLRNEGHYTTR